MWTESAVLSEFGAPAGSKGKRTTKELAMEELSRQEARTLLSVSEEGRF
jgi:hypothetical protein